GEEHYGIAGCIAGAGRIAKTCLTEGETTLVYRLLNLLGFVRQWPDQLAVFQGASEAPISELIRAERGTRKNSQLAAARRVALKMGPRPRCSSVTYRFSYAPLRPPCRTPIFRATKPKTYSNESTTNQQS